MCIDLSHRQVIRRITYKCIPIYRGAYILGYLLTHNTLSTVYQVFPLLDRFTDGFYSIIQFGILYIVTCYKTPLRLDRYNVRMVNVLISKIHTGSASLLFM